MRHIAPVKSLLLALFVISVAVLLLASLTGAADKGQKSPSGVPIGAPDEYVGVEACKKCHEDEFDRFSETRHAAMAHSKHDTGMNQGCEVCHGPGKVHVLAETKRKEAMDLGQEAPEYVPGQIFTCKGKSPKTISESCLGCHAGKDIEHSNYRRGGHWRNDVGCIDCHDPHGMPLPKDTVGSQTFSSTATQHKPNWGAEVMLKKTEPQLCISCHNDVKAQFTMPFRHKVLEGLVTCSDCHNPHGGFENKQARLTTGVDAACVNCHTDKQGPFTFEHAPLKIEGCTACHTPHGSANPKMLKRANVAQLCLECHTDVGSIGIGAPGTPSFHNLTQVKWRNCTTCHAMIHGSMSDTLFFR